MRGVAERWVENDVQRLGRGVQVLHSVQLRDLDPKVRVLVVEDSELDWTNDVVEDVIQRWDDRRLLL